MQLQPWMFICEKYGLCICVGGPTTFNKMSIECAFSMVSFLRYAWACGLFSPSILSCFLSEDFTESSDEMVDKFPTASWLKCNEIHTKISLRWSWVGDRGRLDWPQNLHIGPSRVGNSRNASEINKRQLLLITDLKTVWQNAEIFIVCILCNVMVFWTSLQRNKCSQIQSNYTACLHLFHLSLLSVSTRLDYHQAVITNK
jgi:hypothetical protein